MRYREKLIKLLDVLEPVPMQYNFIMEEYRDFIGMLGFLIV